METTAAKMVSRDDVKQAIATLKEYAMQGNTSDVEEFLFVCKTDKNNFGIGHSFIPFEMIAETISRLYSKLNENERVMVLEFLRDIQAGSVK